jgi:hypothetical protein
MAKMNPLAKQRYNLFNLKFLNELKKDQTNIKIFKNSSFDSSFNSVQSLNTNLSQLQLPPSSLLEKDLYAPTEAPNRLPTTWRQGVAGRGGVKTQGCNSYGFAKKTPALAGSICNKNLLVQSRTPKISAILRAIRFIRLNRDEWNLIRYINLSEKKIRSNPLFLSLLRESKGSLGRATISSINKNNNNNIINKNILLRNMKYNFLKSTLSSILKKKIRKISEVLEDKPIKNYILYSYLKNCIFTSPHLNHGRTKLSLNKYKGRKFGSFINYNKIIGYKFNSTFIQGPRNNAFLGVASPLGSRSGSLGQTNCPSRDPKGEANGDLFVGGVEKNNGNIYIKDTYKLLFFLFKSMYCLISKPVLKYTNDKVTIQLFYYLNIPKKKIFRLFSIYYINSIRDKNKWLFKSFAPKGLHRIPNPLDRDRGPGLALRREGDKQNNKFIRWKLRKAISRLKNKKISNKNLLFKLRKFNLTAKAVFQNKFKLICAILSKKFNKPVELQLIRLHHPYHDSNILVNLLSLNIKNKRKKARVAIQKIYNKKPVKNLNDLIFKNPLLGSEGGTGNILPASLSGLNIKIAGRLMGEPIIPRITTKVFGKGASATGKVNYLDMARITKKNRKGAYTIKITSGQNFF